MKQALQNINWLEFTRKRIAQILLIIFIVFFTLRRPDAFLTTNNMLTIIRQVSVTGVVALGMSFVMLTGGLDFSVGALVSLTGIVAAILIHGGVPFVVAFLIGIICSMAASLVTGFAGVVLNIPILVVSIAVQQIVNGINVVITGNQSIYGFEDSVKFIGQKSVFNVPIPVIILVVCALIVSFVLSKTYFGRHLFTVGGNTRVAKLAGINVVKTRMLASLVCGFMSGLAGVILLSRSGAAGSSVGSGIETDVITAAVLGGVSITGGVGNTSGVITGVLLIGVLNSGLIMMNVDSTIQGIIKGAILLLAVTLDSLATMSRDRAIKLSVRARKEG